MATLQSSCLENPGGRGACRPTGPGATEWDTTQAAERAGTYASVHMLAQAPD